MYSDAAAAALLSTKTVWIPISGPTSEKHPRLYPVIPYFVILPPDINRGSRATCPPLVISFQQLVVVARNTGHGYTTCSRASR